MYIPKVGLRGRGARGLETLPTTGTVEKRKKGERVRDERFMLASRDGTHLLLLEAWPRLIHASDGPRSLPRACKLHVRPFEHPWTCCQPVDWFKGLDPGQVSLPSLA